MSALKTPVAFLIFNRPETTAKVFAEIARAKPARLLIVADGPRPDRPGEKDRCREAQAITERIDWPCEVLRNVAPANMGCKRRIASGLDWVFSECEEAILLEDDCLPHPTFFRYCEELLARYRDEPTVMQINGSRLSPGVPLPGVSYEFSRYPLIWGWATWRRAWNQYDATLRRWADTEGRNAFLAAFAHVSERRYWNRVLTRVFRGQIDTWDHQWAFACMSHGGVSVSPGVNLVTNIGFGAGATHTTGAANEKACVPLRAIEFPLLHPETRAINRQADELLAERFYRLPSVKQGIGYYTRRLLSRFTASPNALR